MNTGDGHGSGFVRLDAHLDERNARFHRDGLAGSKFPGDALELRPVGPSQPHGRIPNTPGAVSLISFVLGGICFLSLSLLCSRVAILSIVYRGPGGHGEYWSWKLAAPPLGFFLAAWSFFHWAEFAVTAGWNREKCSVDCEQSHFRLFYLFIDFTDLVGDGLSFSS